MTEQPVGPRCGNNPNFQMSDGDRKAVDDFKARLALQESAKPYIDSAAWVDGDPLMEVIAATLWKHCPRDDEDMPQAVCDDPRTIAAFAAAVARAHAASAVVAVAVPPTGQTAEVRQKVIGALLDARRPGLGGMSEADAVAYMADAVLPVLPPPADRAAAEAVQYWFDAATERRAERDRLRAVVARVAQMADAWESQLPEVIRTPAVVSALRAALESADDPSRLADEAHGAL